MRATLVRAVLLAQAASNPFATRYPPRSRAGAVAAALLGLVVTALPAQVQGAITVLLPANTHVQVQPGERLKVRNDSFLPDFASTDAPPLRVTAASYNFQGVSASLTITGDLCVDSLDDPDFGFGGVATISLRDDSGATATVQVIVDRGGDGADEADCRDPALVVKQPSYPATAQVAEDGNVLITTAALLAVARDPNGGQVLWDTPSVPASAGIVSIEGSPSQGGGIRFTAARDFNGVARIAYNVTDSDNDGVVAFEADVTVTPVNDPPTATASSCAAAATGSTLCQLSFDDVDTARANLVVTITTQPSGGAVGAVDVANRRVAYTPRPGTTTDGFSYTVSDGDQAPVSANVTVSVSAAPSPPQAVLRVLQSGTIVAESPPNGTASIGGPPDTDQAPGEALRLDGSASLPGTNPSSPVALYHWTVNGQALPQTTATVDLRLADGANTVTLQVEDGLGRVSDAAAKATVQLDVGAVPTVPVDAPQIFFNGSAAINQVNVDNSDFEPGETVLFDASHSASPAQNPIVTYTWTLNGQQAKTGSTPTALLALHDGDNTILLTVTYQQGNTGSVSLTATVKADIDLGALPGLSPSQRSVGTAISELCPRLNGVASTPGEVELLDRCTKILSDTDSQQQRQAIEAITPEEITSQQTTAIDFSKSQAGNLASRLVALRHGAGGVSFAGLSIRDKDGSPIPLEQLAALVKHLTGGAGGDDDQAQDQTRDPAADSLAKKWGFFVNGNLIDGKKDQTANESGFDFGGWGVTTGFDYRFTQHLVAGLSLGYNESNTDFANNAGSLDSDGVTTSLYGTYFEDKWYADFIGSSGGLDYDSSRLIAYSDGSGPHNDTALGATSGDLTTLGASFGYNFSKGGWSFGPTAALTDVEIDIDGFAETGGGTGNALAMRFGDQRAKSRTAQGGFQAGYALSRKWGVLSPQMRVAFVKEFQNDAEVVNVRFVSDPFANDPNQPSPGAITLFTDDPDTEYVRWGVGLSFVRAGGLSAFVNYEGLAGFTAIKSGELTFGARFEHTFK